MVLGLRTGVLETETKAPRDYEVGCPSWPPRLHLDSEIWQLLQHYSPPGPKQQGQLLKFSP